MFVYAVFVDDHEYGSMRMHSLYLDEYAAHNCVLALSPNLDGVSVQRFTMVNACDSSPDPKEDP